METLAPVALDVPAIRRVVERTGGCIVWGGAVRLSPADDILIRVERPLDLDSAGQLVASVISKKAAAGSTHAVVDIPVGPTAKVRSDPEAALLGARLQAVGEALGIRVRVVLTDGSQPVGRGIGPALEARDVLAVLKRDPAAPKDLEQCALKLAGEILEMGSKARMGEGLVLARQVLEDGRARRKFEEIREAQGGAREPPRADFRHPVSASRSGWVAAIDNRLLARAAKLAGAPLAAAAGVDLHTPVGARVERGQPLFTLHAEAPGELDYALEYLAAHPDIVRVEER
jgi:thymidine phosphorylase